MTYVVQITQDIVLVTVTEDGTLTVAVTTDIINVTMSTGPALTIDGTGSLPPGGSIEQLLIKYGAGNGEASWQWLGTEHVKNWATSDLSIQGLTLGTTGFTGVLHFEPTVAEDATAFDYIRFGDDNITATDWPQIEFEHSGSTSVQGDFHINRDLYIDASSVVELNLDVDGTLQVLGAIGSNNNITLDGDLRVNAGSSPSDYGRIWFQDLGGIDGGFIQYGLDEYFFRTNREWKFEGSIDSMSDILCRSSNTDITDGGFIDKVIVAEGGLIHMDFGNFVTARGNVEAQCRRDLIDPNSLGNVYAHNAVWVNLQGNSYPDGSQGNVFFRCDGDNNGAYIRKLDDTTPTVTPFYFSHMIDEAATLPDQTGNTGKVLTADAVGGTVWGDVDGLPDQTGHDGEYLRADLASGEWIAPGFFCTVQDGISGPTFTLPTEGLGTLRFQSSDSTVVISVSENQTLHWIDVDLKAGLPEDIETLDINGSATDALDMTAGGITIQSTGKGITFSDGAVLNVTNPYQSGPTFSTQLNVDNNLHIGSGNSSGSTFLYFHNDVAPEHIDCDGAGFSFSKPISLDSIYGTATLGYVLTTDGTPNGAYWALPTGAGGGEANTAQSMGVGTSLFYRKFGVDLQFYSIKSQNSLLTVALDSLDIGLTVNEGNIVHQNISGKGTYDHSEIDTHIGSLPNSHIDWTSTNANFDNTTGTLNTGAATAVSLASGTIATSGTANDSINATGGVTATNLFARQDVYVNQDGLTEGYLVFHDGTEVTNNYIRRDADTTSLFRFSDPIDPQDMFGVTIGSAGDYLTPTGTGLGMNWVKSNFVQVIEEGLYGSPSETIDYSTLDVGPGTLLFTGSGGVDVALVQQGTDTAQVQISLSGENVPDPLTLNNPDGNGDSLILTGGGILVPYQSSIRLATNVAEDEFATIRGSSDALQIGGLVNMEGLLNLGDLGRTTDYSISFISNTTTRVLTQVYSDGSLHYNGAFEATGGGTFGAATTINGKLTVDSSEMTLVDKGIQINEAVFEDVGTGVDELQFSKGVTSGSGVAALQFTHSGVVDELGYFSFNRQVVSAAITSNVMAISDSGEPTSYGSLTFTQSNDYISSDKGLDLDGDLTFTSGTYSHTVASHSDTTATGTQLNTLVGGGETALHSHAGGGSGDVVGPAGAVDSNIAAFDLATGKLIKDSGVAYADIGTNTTHISSDGKDHSDVVLNNTHRALTSEHIDWTSTTSTLLTTGNLKAQDFYLNNDGDFGDAYMYFGYDGDPQSAFLKWTGADENLSYSCDVIYLASIRSNSIAERTADTGVTVDTLLIKDGDIPTLITGRTEETSPTSDDMILLYEATGAVNKKVSLANLPTGTAAYSDESGALIADAHNLTGSTITAGTPVYISGYNVGLELIQISEADASSSATMPALGLVKADITNATSGQVVVSGALAGFDTSGFTAGDPLYVSETTGTLTSTRPTGATVEVQKMGLVLRSHATLGKVGVIGAGRTNDVPNIAEGKFWQGDSTGVAAEVEIEEAIQVVLGDGSAVISSTQEVEAIVKCDMTITAWTVVETTATTGSIVVDVWEDTYANYPPTVADTITGAEKPTITTSTKGQDISLNSGAGWALTKGSVLRFHVDSVTSCKQVTVALTGVRS